MCLACILYRVLAISNASYLLPPHLFLARTVLYGACRTSRFLCYLLYASLMSLKILVYVLNNLVLNNNQYRAPSENIHGTEHAIVSTSGEPPLFGRLHPPKPPSSFIAWCNSLPETKQPQFQSWMCRVL
jgi:hypothetical protein